MRIRSTAFRAAFAAVAALAILGLVSCAAGEDHPSAKGGLVDFAKEGDPGRDRIWLLEGEWEFHPEVFLGPGDQRIFEGREPRLLEVPGRGMKAAWGTYRLRVILPPHLVGKTLGIESREMNTAALVFVDGGEVARIGAPSATPALARPANRNMIGSFTPERGEATIVVHISNHENAKGGILEAPRIGLLADLAGQASLRGFFDAVVLGALFFMFLYHLFLYFVRRREKAALHLAIVVFLLLSRKLLTEPYLYSWLDVYDTLIRVEYLTFYAIVPAFVLLMRETFLKRLGKAFIVGLLALAAALSILTLVSPLAFCGRYYLVIYQYATLGAAIHCAGSLVMALARREPGILPHAVISVILMASGVAEILFYMRAIATVSVTQFGFLFFFLGQAAIMASRNAKTSRGYEELNQDLEVKVERRTAELKEAMKALEEASLTDALTGLRNRRFVHESIVPRARAIAARAEFHRANPEKRQVGAEETSLGLLLLDIDHFKRVNDGLGHEAGDLVLAQFARRLKENLRGDDLVVRWGGEEFLVVLENARLETVLAMADKLRGRIAGTPFRVSHAEAPTLAVTASIGCCVFPFFNGAPGLVDFGTAVRLADLGLYEAKHAGRNRSRRLSPGPAVTALAEPGTLDASLESLVERGILVVEGAAVAPGADPAPA
ncbi:MAG: diguanylate cyclase [Spirochaetaceae bacterium]|nr:diguanylate cyclase [Spirochaetaceae bacterium]